MQKTSDRTQSHHGSWTPAAASRTERRAMLAGLAVLVVTVVHHVYGAIRYETPERYHAVVIAVVALALMLSAFALSRKRPASLGGRAGWWISWGLNVVVSVLLFGLIEGLYNHTVKVALYFGGLPEVHLRRLFPDPTFELPNDVFFEVTGVLHVLPAAFAAYYLARLLIERRSGAERASFRST